MIFCCEISKYVYLISIYQRLHTVGKARHLAGLKAIGLQTLPFR